MGKIFMAQDSQGNVVATATTVVNGSHRRVGAKVPKATDDDTIGKEQWRQAVFDLFQEKARVQNGASEPEQETQWQQ